MPNSKIYGTYRNRVEKKELVDLTFSELDNPFNFFNLLQSDSFNTWLRKNNLLATEIICQKCGGVYTIKKRKSSITGESFRCNEITNMNFLLEKDPSLKP